MNSGFRRLLSLAAVFIIAFLAVSALRNWRSGGTFRDLIPGLPKKGERFRPERFTLPDAPPLDLSDVGLLARLNSEYARLTEAVVPSVVSIDTAGIRELNGGSDEVAGPDGDSDQVERIGIERAWSEVAKADVILHMLDAARGPTRADEQIAERFPADVPVLRVWNKIDLSGHKPAADRMPDATHVYLSAAERRGIDLLRAELLRIAGWQQTGESLYLARERHIAALKAARSHLEHAAELASAERHINDQALDLFAEELRLAQDRLASITGEFTPDDLLGAIFSRFCIGK